MPLTDRAIVHARPHDKPWKLSDVRGLYLLVNPSGSKLWYLKYRFAGKEKKLALGGYPEVTLAEARRKREEARELLASGKDPSQKRKDEKSVVPADFTYKSVALDWANSNVRWSKEHAVRVRRYFELYVFPLLGARDFKTLSVPELIAPIKAVEKAGKRGVARRLQQRTVTMRSSTSFLIFPPHR